MEIVIFIIVLVIIIYLFKPVNEFPDQKRKQNQQRIRDRNSYLRDHPIENEFFQRLKKIHFDHWILESESGNVYGYTQYSFRVTINNGTIISIRINHEMEGPHISHIGDIRIKNFAIYIDDTFISSDVIFGKIVREYLNPVRERHLSLQLKEMKRQQVHKDNEEHNRRIEEHNRRIEEDKKKKEAIKKL